MKGRNDEGEGIVGKNRLVTWGEGGRRVGVWGAGDVCICLCVCVQGVGGASSGGKG